MAKTEATRRSKRLNKVAQSAAVGGQTETVSSSEETVRAEDAAKDNSDEQDPQMDAVLEVKGNTSTVAVSWDKTDAEGEVDEPEKTASPSDQMMESEEPAQIISAVDAVGSTEDSPSESAETKVEQEMTESEECQVDIVAGSAATVTVTWEEKNQEGESDPAKGESDAGEQTLVKKKPVKGKRTARSTVETSPAKKPKLINDGFCLFVGNLNKSKAFDEVKDSLANYFMTQSLLVQDIRLDRSKKHAHVDLASEMDLTKGLTLDGQMLNDQPMKIAKAKVKKEEVKSEAEDKKVKDGRCLFLKNVPYNATKTDIKKIFPTAIRVRFPGGTEKPSKGIAFVEFKNRAILKTARWRKREVKILGRVVIMDGVGENRQQATEDPPNTTLFVSKLPRKTKEDDLQKVFEKAVSVSIPKRQGTSRGFAFVEFADVVDAEKALKASKNMKIYKRALRVQFCKISAKTKLAKGPSKTLIVMGLAVKTTAETLKDAFDGSVSARVTVDKQTGVSKGFGFVEFESEDDSKAAKEVMDDCEIDGNKVTVAFALSETKRPRRPAKNDEPPAEPEEPPAEPEEPPAEPEEPPAEPEEPPAGGRKGKGAKRKRKGKRGAGTPQEAVKVENKD